MSGYRWPMFQEELIRIISRIDSVNEIHREDMKYLRPVFVSLRQRSQLSLAERIKLLKECDPDNPAFLKFGLLNVLHGTGLRETAHTRLLAWILDPQKRIEHEIPEAVVAPLLGRMHQNMNWPSGKLSISNVVAEKVACERKRIDIWIEGSLITTAQQNYHWLIVIEAKLEAELSDQLAYYELEAKKWQDQDTRHLDPCFIYLKDGSKADFETKYDWEPLDFRELVSLLWPGLKKCKEAAGYHLMRCYLAGLLADVAGWELPIGICENVADYSMIRYLSVLENMKTKDESM